MGVVVIYFTGSCRVESRLVLGYALYTVIFIVGNVSVLLLRLDLAVIDDILSVREDEWWLSGEDSDDADDLFVCRHHI